MGVSCSVDARCCASDCKSNALQSARDGESGFLHSSYLDRELHELNELKKCGRTLANNIAYVFKTGSCYTGQWLKNMRHGYGKHEWPDGTCFEGQWSANLTSGMGRFVHQGIDMYIGQWEKSMAHGLGIFYHNRGQLTYMGQWRYDFQHGFGIEVGTDLPVYEGSFCEGQKHGWGSYKWADGSTYEGSWCEDVLHGPGNWKSSDGRRFSGQWHDSVMHGMGHYTWPEGRTYGGQYYAGAMDGFGKSLWPDGKTYEGYWSNDKPSCENQAIHELEQIEPRKNYGPMEDIEKPIAHIGSNFEAIKDHEECLSKKEVIGFNGLQTNQ